MFPHKRRPAILNLKVQGQQTSTDSKPPIEPPVERNDTEECFEFVQVECGQTHTLLLNKRGDVFSFGQGLSGQLGTNKRVIQQWTPTQILFEDELGYNIPIGRI